MPFQDPVAVDRMAVPAQPAALVLVAKEPAAAAGAPAVETAGKGVAVSCLGPLAARAE
jgi:hypothetical protein